MELHHHVDVHICIMRYPINKIVKDVINIVISVLDPLLIANHV